MTKKTKHILALIGIVFLYLVAASFLGAGTQVKTPDAPYLIVAGWVILAISIVLNILFVKKKKSKQKEDSTDERS